MSDYVTEGFVVALIMLILLIGLPAFALLWNELKK